MDAFNAWRFAPATALYLARQSLSDQETNQILKPLQPGGWACHAIETFRKRILNAEKINVSENRAAGHWALRAAGCKPEAANRITGFTPEREDLLPRMRAVHHQAQKLANDVREGVIKSETGKPFESVLHIGIGGSDIGPKLLIDAFKQQANHGTRGVNFLSNLDYHAVQHTLSKLNPHQTLLVIASKSFTTQETVTNARHVFQWMRNAGITCPEKQCVAVTQRTDRASQWAIPEHQILWFDESIGGRFSIWGPVSLTPRIILGNDAVDAFIAGGVEMDADFIEAPPAQNLAAILATIDLYNLRQRKLPTMMVSAYDSRLEMLVPYLKQLWMESLGKHVDAMGTPLEGPSCPVLWGDVGTNAQHAFFQLLHQGGQGVAVELIGAIEPAHAAMESHYALLSNLVAQAQALSIGNEDADPHKSCFGGHPVNVLLIDRCDSRSLGALIALWEHRVECMAALTGLNPFDQWGVELGKKIASAALEEFQETERSTSLQAGPDTEALDEKSLQLIQHIKRG